MIDKQIKKNEANENTNRRRFNIVSLSFVFLVCSISLYAQDVPIATISGSGKITLDPNQPVSSIYQADISNLQFSDEEAAKAFLETLEDGATTISLDFLNKKATIHLALKMLADANMHWDVNQWNEYFLKKEEAIKRTKGQ